MDKAYIIHYERKPVGGFKATECDAEAMRDGLVI
jgi:hypothetical protein